MVRSPAFSSAAAIAALVDVACVAVIPSVFSTFAAASDGEDSSAIAIRRRVPAIAPRIPSSPITDKAAPIDCNDRPAALPAGISPDFSELTRSDIVMSPLAHDRVELAHDVLRVRRRGV